MHKAGVQQVPPFFFSTQKESSADEIGWQNYVHCFLRLQRSGLPVHGFTHHFKIDHQLRILPQSIAGTMSTCATKEVGNCEKFYSSSGQC